MTAVISLLVTYLLHSTLILGSALILVRFSPFRPAAVRDLLLRGALCLPLLTAGVGPVFSGQAGPTTAAKPTTSVRPQTVFPEQSEMAAHSAPSEGQPGLWRVQVSDTAPLWLALVVWVSLGCAGVRVGVAWWLVRSRLGRVVEDRALTLQVEQLAAVARGPAAHLRWADIAVPCALGRRTILLPPNIIERLSPRELTAVLAHEYAHLRRHDPLWTLGLSVLAQVLWLQPLNRWALTAWRRASEECCDHWAARSTEPRALAQALLRLTEPGHAHSHSWPLLTSAAIGSTHLMQRMTALMRPLEAPMNRLHVAVLAGFPLLLWAFISPLALAVTPAAPHGVVVLDAGHGGDDPGVVGFVREKDVTLALALQLQAQLEKGGVQVILTRRGDERPAFEERLRLARQPARLFLSLHTDASPDAQSSGVRAYVSSVAQPHEQTSRAVAGQLLDAVTLATGAKNLGVQPMDYSVLTKASVPAVLFSVGFATNPQEGRQLQNASYQKLLSTALARSVLTALR
ncbi:M48 family metalloprotease [Deinococcus sp. HMF7620]|uniref:M48 family metalloprotease n=1 Tax=Deinococcus arboris TaxID=2682977 RepID=A0A7C9LP20_9DEIO|nr:M56/M15 family metallopeptidase [Deinococcus arboris]MVN89458.1 M48 family metalloprotease [Deinococcus arboris]